MNPLTEKKELWVGIRREPEGGEDRSTPEEQFWEKHENAAKHGTKLRG
jgi:hypothetical protein